MKKTITEASRAFFNKQSLDERQLAGLDQLMRTQALPYKEYVQWFAMVASVAIVFVFSFILGRGTLSMQDISEEVVYSHIKNMPLEVEASEFNVVRSYFSKLDFSLQDSEFISQANAVMLGGRYCSIGGVAAAQLHYKKPSQGMTLYQVPYDKGLYGDVPDYTKQQKPHVSYVRGYRVEIWQENGVLMACVMRDEANERRV